MSIASEITRLQNAKSDIKASIENKGVTVGDGTIDTYASKINEISTSSAVLGTKTITENGTYKAIDDNLDGYSEVNVQLKGTEPQFTGHYDKIGLKTIGWSDDEINYYQKNGVQWNDTEDEYFKLTDTELIGDDSKNTRFLPKNTTKKIFENYYKLLAIPQLNTSEVTYMYGMFSYCYSLTTIPLLDTSKATNMSNMFRSCNSLTTIPQLNTSEVTNMSSMFNSCCSLTTIPQLNTSKATNMSDMFNSCYSLITIPQLNTSNVTTIDNMFRSCYSLKIIPMLDTSKVTNMSNMFSNCYSLKIIPMLDTSKVTNMSNMFNNCYSLIIIPQLDTSKVTNMSNMFSNCYSLTTIPQLNTSEVTNMSGTFSICRSLMTIPQLNTSKVTNINGMLYQCTLLTDFGGLENLGQAYSTTQSANYGNYKLDLSTCTALTEQSLINVLNNLYDIATKGCKPQQVVLGSTNLAKLTAEEVAIGTSKGWSIS